MLQCFAERSAAYLEKDQNRLEIQKYLDIYLEMMVRLYKGDITQDATFRRLYNVFYKLRFAGSNGHTSGEIYEAYYHLLENHKQNGGQPAIEEVLDELWRLTGKVHLSFASKLMGTLYPQSAPIWDSNVRTLLEIPYRPQKGQPPLALAAAAYHELERRYIAFTPTPQAIQVFAVFDQAFPTGREIADWKKIDFLLWRMGSRKGRREAAQ